MATTEDYDELKQAIKQKDFFDRECEYCWQLTMIHTEVDLNRIEEQNEQMILLVDIVMLCTNCDELRVDQFVLPIKKATGKSF